MAITPLKFIRKEKVGVFPKIQLICCRIGTKPFKISEKMAKKHELEVGNLSLKWNKSNAVNFYPFFKGVANLKFFFLSHFPTNFERFGAYPAAFMLNFPKHTNFFPF